MALGILRYVPNVLGFDLLLVEAAELVDAPVDLTGGGDGLALEGALLMAAADISRPPCRSQGGGAAGVESKAKS